ncbi:hypothetical protein D3C76_338680 [compost metagenome]
MIMYHLASYQWVSDRLRQLFIAVSDSYSQMVGPLWLCWLAADFPALQKARTVGAEGDGLTLASIEDGSLLIHHRYSPYSWGSRLG